MHHYLPKWLSGIHSFRSLNNKGVVLPVILSFSLVFALEIAGLAEYASTTFSQVRQQEIAIRNQELAEAATEFGLAQAKLYLQKTGNVLTQAQLDGINDVNNLRQMRVNDASFSFKNNANQSTFNMSYGAVQNKVLTTGPYAGLNGRVTPLTVTITSKSKKGNVTKTSTITQTAETQLIPIFQFGVFYQNDLEINPGATMNFTGPVHTNANLYLSAESGNSLSFNHYNNYAGQVQAPQITSFGNIYHDRKDNPGNPSSGNVYIEEDHDNNGTWPKQNMLKNGVWLDSTESNWATASQSRWYGNVKSSDHGVRALNLPLPAAYNPETLLDRKSNSDDAQVQGQKMEYKANIRIIDGAVMDQNGNAVELRYCSAGGTFDGSTNSCPQGETVVNPITNVYNTVPATTFHNFREATAGNQTRIIKSTDIDVAKLNASPGFQSIISGLQTGVVIYASDHRSTGSTTYQDAVRLVNGSALPTKGLTLASDNPVYVKGNFNTVNQQPSGILGDSFNILSNNWSDANSSNTNLSNRSATSTTIKTAVITGNNNSTVSHYNGGFENIHRLLENWTGKTLTYSGSVVVLFNSRQATGQWVYGGSYYTAPTRNWGFNTNLSDPNYSIPGFPSVYTVVKSKWEST